MKSKLKSSLFRFASMILSVLLVLGVGEVCVRLFVPKYIWSYRDTASDLQIDKSIGWVQKPNLDISFRCDDGRKRYFRTNQDGLFPYSAQRPRKKNEIRIMFFGDSTVVGISVPQDKNVTSVLEHLLNAEGYRAEVINAGVESYSTDQVYMYMQRNIPLYKPDIVVYCVCANDFDGNVVRIAYDAPKPMFRMRKDAGLEEIPPFNKDGKIPVFGKGPRRWVQFSALYRFYYPSILKFRMKLFNWKQANLMGLPPEFYYRKESLSSIDWDIFTALLRRMRELCLENNAEFFFYLNPDIQEVWDPYIAFVERKFKLRPGDYDRFALERKLTEIAADNKIYFCPQIDYFLKNRSRGPFHLLPRDPHCNEAGYQVSAEKIASFILDKDLLRERNN